MASNYVSGPCYIYISLQRATAGGAIITPATTVAKADIRYLGTCEQAPRIRLNPQYEGVVNEKAGIKLPIDYSYQGEDGEVAGTLTEWNELVYERIQNKPAQSGTLGKNVVGDIGSLLQLEGYTFHTWIHFPYVTKVYGTTLSMPACYHFPACRAIGEELSLGTVANKRLFAIAADRYYNAADCSITVYDNVLNASIPTAPCTTNVVANTGVLV